MAGKKKTVFDHFDHPTLLHKKDSMLALINKFPGLQGYGIFCYLMEMCGRNLDGKIPFNKFDRIRICETMNVDPAFFTEVVEYLVNIAKEINLNKAGDMIFLSVDMLNRDQIKKRIKRDASRNRMAERRLKDKKQGGVRVDVKESSREKRKRIIKAFDEILILTDRIIEDASLKFPKHGSIRVYFKHFRVFCRINYKELWGQITHENYVLRFYLWMNQQKEPLLEALEDDERANKDFRKTTRTPTRINL